MIPASMRRGVCCQSSRCLLKRTLQTKANASGATFGDETRTIGATESRDEFRYLDDAKSRAKSSSAPDAGSRKKLYGTKYNHFIVQNGQDSKNSPDDVASSDTKRLRLAIKDNIATAELPTQCASGILSDHQSPYEATIVGLLRSRHDAEVVGKTNMDEFGMGTYSTNTIHGAVRNPLGVGEDAREGDSISAGGSSGGSAVAVSTEEADMALGTDTGGSVRIPAAFTGCVGYKPSYGMISRYGVVPYANSLDTVGFFAREASMIQQVVFDSNIHLEHDNLDPTSLSTETRTRLDAQTPKELPRFSELKIGIPLEYNLAELDPLIRKTWIEACNALESLGATIVPVSLPSTKEALCAYYLLAPAEASSNLAKYDGVRYGMRNDESDGAGGILYSETRGAGFGEEVKRRILLGTYSLSSEAMDNYFIQAQKVRRLVRRDFDRVFRAPNPLHDDQQFDLSDMPDTTLLEDKQGPAQVDFLLCPTTPTMPPTLEQVRQQRSVDSYANDVFTVPASLAGLPAVSVPAQVEGSRFPAGLQVIGQFWDDRRVLALADKLMTAVARR